MKFVIFAVLFAVGAVAVLADPVTTTITAAPSGAVTTATSGDASGAASDATSATGGLFDGLRKTLLGKGVASDLIDKIIALLGEYHLVCDRIAKGESTKKSICFQKPREHLEKLLQVVAHLLGALSKALSDPSEYFSHSI